MNQKMLLNLARFPLAIGQLAGHAVWRCCTGWVWLLILLGVSGCTPGVNETLTPPTTLQAIPETAVFIHPIPTRATAVFLPITPSPSMPALDPLLTATPTPRIARIAPPTHVYQTATPYPFVRPDSCFPPDEPLPYYPENYKQFWKACTDLQYSPDGEWIAVLVGLDICGTDVGLYHQPTDRFKIYVYGGAKYLEFLPDNRLLVQWGSCSNREMDIINPVTGEAHRLGDSGNRPFRWNKAHTAFITIIPGWEVNDAFAIYSTETNGALWIARNFPSEGKVYWIEDPTYILFEQRTYTYVYTPEGDDEYVIDPRQIVRVSLDTKTSTVLTNDPTHSYFLMDCETVEDDCSWPQDWVQVRRVPHVVEDFYRYSNRSGMTKWQCISSGHRCSQPAEIIWLNWRTGEIKVETRFSDLPTATPTLPGWLND